MSMLECMQSSVPKPTVERIAQAELVAPLSSTNMPVKPTASPESSTNMAESGSTNSPEVALTGSTNRQMRWRERNPSYKEWKRTYQREYMRRRRAQ